MLFAQWRWKWRRVAYQSDGITCLSHRLSLLTTDWSQYIRLLYMSQCTSATNIEAHKIKTMIDNQVKNIEVWQDKTSDRHI